MKPSAARNTIFIVIILALTILSFSFLGKEIKGFFYSISVPVQKAFWQSGQSVASFFNLLSGLGLSEQENKDLQDKYIQLLAESARLENLKKENDTLRQALNLQLQKEFNLVFAQTVSRDSMQDFITIDKGSKNGIKAGMPVITSQKILCGKISEVYDNFSRVMLVSSPQSSFDAEIMRPDAIPDIFGVVKGQGELNMELALVPRDKDLIQGDSVITSSLEGIFPRGLLVGQIETANKEDIEPFQSAVIKPLFGLQDLDTVFVILSPVSSK